MILRCDGLAIALVRIVWKSFLQSGITFHSVWLTYEYIEGKEMI